MRTNKSNSSNLVVFAFCLGIALLFWLVSNCSKSYERNFKWELEYVNVPQGKSITSATNEVNVAMETTGWQLIFNNFTKQNLKIDLSGKTGNIVNHSVRSLLDEDLKKMEILSIEPATITIEMQKEVGKMIPVKPNYSIELSKNYYPASVPQTKPDSVFIQGNSEALDSLDFILTEKFVLKGKDNFNKSVKLEIPNKLNSSINEVGVNVAVEQFTEKTFDLPVILENAPESLDYTMYPQSAKVSFLVPFSKYEATFEDDFELTVDFENLEQESQSEYKINVEVQPNFVKNVQITPDVVNLIIYE